MAGPWEKFSTGPWQKYAAVDVQDRELHEQRLASAESALAGQQAPKPGAVTEYSSALFRPIAKGVTALPLMAMDAGVGARNLVSGGNYELPSATFNRALDANTLAPQSAVGKIAEGASSMVVGAALPTPSVPAAKAKAPTLRDQALIAGQKEGYVVPPTTTNPSMVNKVLEGTAGKLTTAQQASAQNQAVTNKLIARAFGLPDDAQITRSTLDGIRKQAGKAYDAIRSIGTVTADARFSRDLAGISAKYKGAAKSFPGLANSAIDDAIASVSKSQFEADSAVDAIAILRDKASVAGKQGDKGLATAYRSVANAVEGAVERFAANKQGNAGAVTRFRQARETIAKVYSVGKAINPATGDISATKLAQQLQREAPLSGEIKKVAEFASAFPKAARSFSESFPGVSPLDAYGAGGLAAVTGNPTPLLYPFGRMGIRNFLLSPAGQKLALSRGPASVSPRAVNTLAAGIESAR
jgi:hypothetical protein